eukprot:TRINITY_DN1524_c1_g3_i2.p2 TRINITY_DN1524_c1_g3~~TRINITY_DN1524_c1_g3_i2.p2  ORF type:complete len:701 (-),score=251.08 TRINITY_DN1524_c1_g3_i2:4241-6343(-)
MTEGASQSRRPSVPRSIDGAIDICRTMQDLFPPPSTETAYLKRHISFQPPTDGESRPSRVSTLFDGTEYQRGIQERSRMQSTGDRKSDDFCDDGNADEHGRAKAEGLFDELTNGLKEELRQGEEVDEVDTREKIHEDSKKKKKSGHTKHTVSIPTVPILDGATSDDADDRIDQDEFDGKGGVSNGSDWMGEEDDVLSLDEKEEFPNESHRPATMKHKDDVHSREEDRRKEPFQSTAPLEKDILSAIASSDVKEKNLKTMIGEDSFVPSSPPMGMDDVVTGMLERAMEQGDDAVTQQSDADVYDEASTFWKEHAKKLDSLRFTPDKRDSSHVDLDATDPLEDSYSVDDDDDSEEEEDVEHGNRRGPVRDKRPTRHDDIMGQIARTKIGDETTPSIDLACDESHQAILSRAVLAELQKFKRKKKIVRDKKIRESQKILAHLGIVQEIMITKLHKYQQQLHEFFQKCEEARLLPHIRKEDHKENDTHSPRETQWEELEGEFEHLMSLDPSKDEALSIFDLLNRLNDAERECSSTARKFDSCKKDRDDLSKTVTNLESEITRLRDIELKSKNEELDEFRARISRESELEERVASLDCQCQAQLNEIQMRDEILDKHAHEIREKEQEIETLRLEIECAKKEAKTIESAMSTERKEYEDSHEKREKELRLEYEGLMNEMEEDYKRQITQLHHEVFSLTLFCPDYEL